MSVGQPLPLSYSWCLHSGQFS